MMMMRDLPCVSHSKSIWQKETFTKNANEKKIYAICSHFLSAFFFYNMPCCCHQCWFNFYLMSILCAILCVMHNTESNKNVVVCIKLILLLLSLIKNTKIEPKKAKQMRKKSHSTGQSRKCVWKLCIHKNNTFCYLHKTLDNVIG